MIDQIILGVLGTAAVFTSQSPQYNVRRWACIFGLISQPWWFYMTWEAGQYGIFALCWLYAFSWARGFWIYWVKGMINNEP